jgi:transposase
MTAPAKAPARAGSRLVRKKFAFKSKARARARREAAFSRADRPHLGNVGFYLLRTGCPWRLLPKEFPS